MSKSIKELKRIEIQKKKFQLEQERSLKPGECNRFVIAVVNVVNGTAGSKIVEKLNEIDIKVKLTGQTTPNTITWKRQINKRIITDEGKVIEFDSVDRDEPYLLIILSAEAFVTASKENKLLNSVLAAQESLPFDIQSTTLVVYGLKDFCRKKKNVIGMKETEIKLTQLQLLANCSHRLHETADDVALTVMQMSKAIAEEPFKIKQNEKLDREQLFLTGDIKVDAREEDIQSLANLWQTQLINLPKVTFEVAQSIRKEYPLPRILIESYKKSTNPQAMLADIQIIRTDPLAKQRRIGPELSRKIHTLMTSKNPDDIM